MILKPGVKLTNLQPQILLAMIVAESVYHSFQTEFVITSVDDSKHGATTLHGKGMAFDCRTRDLSKEDAKLVVYNIKQRLGNDFDVILESDHIHIEYDEKL